MSGYAEIDRDLQALAGLIARARSELEAGDLIDLAPLEPKVGALCQRIVALPDAAGTNLRASLLGLIEDLARLSRTIESRLEEVKRHLGDSSERRRAITAYAKGGPTK